MWELQVKFYLGQNEGYSPGNSISASSEKLLQRGRKESQYIRDFSEEGLHAIRHIFFAEGFCELWVTMKDFSAFLGMRNCKNWAHKIGSWKYLTMWRPVLPVVLEHRVPHFFFPPWTPFSGCWKLTAIAAYDLILDGKCQFVVDKCKTTVSSVLVNVLRFWFFSLHQY